jgi:hypothetical protein
MPMGKRKRDRQPAMWVINAQLPTSASHPFYRRMNGYFVGIDAERGIAWRAADSLALRDFLGVGLDQRRPTPRPFLDAPSDRTQTHRAVFTCVLRCFSTVGLVKGKTTGVDATTLEANAALRSIVRRDSGDSDEEFLTTLAKAGADRSKTEEERSRPSSMSSRLDPAMPVPQERRRALRAKGTRWVPLRQFAAGSLRASPPTAE